uniref:Uncharacterized protein LOC111109401 isoform X1 n=1 Tax=Crassostrea virginica TaxID=6565 RepID=A0A8B8BEI2_CRAVI|nr:uncharacterized protein LOC111109401 isoform X1 [Crassostrea virginica]
MDNSTCKCDCTSKACTPGSVLAGMIVGILITVLLLRGKWGWIKLYVIKKFQTLKRKPKAVANASYEPDFQFAGNAGNLLEGEDYQNVVINDEKEVNIVERPASDEIPGDDNVYAVSLKHVKKQAGLASDIIQKIASLHENSSKIIVRKSQEFEDFVDIEKNSTANEKLSRSATLPISKGPAEPAKSSSTNKSGEMKSKGKKKKTSKPTTNAISSPDTQTAQTPKEQTSGVETAKPDYVMREASQNGEYFVLDKTFC